MISSCLKAHLLELRRSLWTATTMSRCLKVLLQAKNKVSVLQSIDTIWLTHPKSHCRRHHSFLPRHYRTQCLRCRCHHLLQGLFPRHHPPNLFHHLQGFRPFLLPPQVLASLRIPVLQSPDSHLYPLGSLFLRHLTITYLFPCLLPRLGSSPGNRPDLVKILFRSYHIGLYRDTHHCHRSPAP